MSKNIKILIATFLVLLLLLLGGCMWLSKLVNAARDPSSAFIVTTPEPEAPEATQPPVSAVEASATPTPEPSIEPDTSILRDRLNILLLGWDESRERNDEDSALYRDAANNFRSDAILLLTIDFETGEADLLSIPRDTYARIYNTEGKWKINAAFAKGGAAEGDGFNYTMKTVSEFFGGIQIDYYAGVNMEGLKNVVDAMGGVDYDVDVAFTLNGRKTTIGMQHMNGQQVLDYCRVRKGIGTDLNRADRQQKMLFAIFNQLKNDGKLMDFIKVYLAVKDKIRTNLSTEQIAALLSFANGMDREKLNRHILKGKYLKAYGISFFVLDQAAKQKLVKEVFGKKLAFDTPYDAGFVEVEGGAYDLANQARKLLKGGASLTLEESAAISEAVTAFEEYYAQEPDDKTLEGAQAMFDALTQALDMVLATPTSLSPGLDALDDLPDDETPVELIDDTDVADDEDVPDDVAVDDVDVFEEVIELQ